MNVSDVEAGCLGIEKEGWFDPWTLLKTLRQFSTNNGTRFLNAEVVDFTFQERRDIMMSGVLEGTYEGIDEIVVSTSRSYRSLGIITLKLAIKQIKNTI